MTPDPSAPSLDVIALAYAQNPNTVGRLLASHAARVIALDVAAVTDTPDHQRAMRAAAANGTRDALLDQIAAVRAAEQPLADVIPLAAARTAQNGHRA
ncbi:hypothetical protein RI578_22880 [Streptomyces sp. BB1-1-1]|uniref:hypothetical protein n=1 Tax=Streptomyces sp. BB1-1-1 TaxID=3074430 RepID=UPI0028774FCD|nr:hypothetical protein [Streptomyces sp. BB1-1-1]WND36956.1 hypothetical protein RI578_22880 [Streptomyces sp. BB1-1-1]